METPHEGITVPIELDNGQTLEAKPSLPPSLPFTSQAPKVGDPPLAWEDFENPKLRRFPGLRDDIRLRRFLGRGEDGYVIKARIKGQEDPVVVKIVCSPCRMNQAQLWARH